MAVDAPPAITPPQSVPSTGLDPATLTAGRIVEARVVSLAGGQAVLASRHGALEADLGTAKAAVGDVLRFEVRAVEGGDGRSKLTLGLLGAATSPSTPAIPTPNAMATEDPARALAQAVGRAAAAQTGLAPLFSTLSALASAPADTVPAPVRALVGQLMGARLAADGAPTAESVARAFKGSGLFLESRAASGGSTPTPAEDLKAGLLTLRDALGKWVGGAAAGQSTASAFASTASGETSVVRLPSGASGSGVNADGTGPVRPGGAEAATTTSGRSVLAAYGALGGVIGRAGGATAAPSAPGGEIEASVRRATAAYGGGAGARAPSPAAGGATTVSGDEVSAPAVVSTTTQSSGGVAPVAARPTVVGTVVPPPGAATGGAGPTTAPNEAVSATATAAATSEASARVSPGTVPAGAAPGAILAPAVVATAAPTAEAATGSAATPTASPQVPPGAGGVPGAAPGVAARPDAVPTAVAGAQAPAQPSGAGGVAGAVAPPAPVIPATQAATIAASTSATSASAATLGATASSSSGVTAQAASVGGVDRDRTLRPPPPRRGQAPRGQAALPVDDLRRGESVEGLGARALERTEGALQRILLEQYAVLDTRGDDAAATAEVRAQQREWTAELPLATATGTSIVQMTVERDAPEAGATAASSGWRVRFALDVEPIGPVHAQIGLAGEHLSIGLWVERADMAARLADEVGQLRGALEAAAIPVEAIHLSTGAPPTAGRAATAGSGRFIDVSL